MPQNYLSLFLLRACVICITTVNLSCLNNAQEHAGVEKESELASRFAVEVQPFINQFCIDCHGNIEPESELDLSVFNDSDSVAAGHQYWALVLERLQRGDMPPDDAPQMPKSDQRAAIARWIEDFRSEQANKDAGDPGIVLARRLSHSEYNYTIRDLTGVDMRPTQDFPVDPTNQAGFDNSGEALVMSPTLFNKYIAAARDVADHMYLQPDGFSFAPTPMIVETDRDQFCVHQIIDFYNEQNTNYADYFLAAWQYKHRVVLGFGDATIDDIARRDHVSVPYLRSIWSALEDTAAVVGPFVKLQTMWRELPTSIDQDDTHAVETACRAMSDYVVQLRKKVEMRFVNFSVGKVGYRSQPLLIWKNVQYATHRRSFDPTQLQVAGETAEPSAIEELGRKDSFGPGPTVLVVNQPDDPDLQVPAEMREEFEAEFTKFCQLFPDMFYKQERGRNYFDTTTDKGRYLSAGFHNIMGYFRDDQPLYELVLDDSQRAELDRMWYELDFVASASKRMYTQFSRAGGPGENNLLAEGDGDEHTDEEATEVTSESNIRKLEAIYIDRAGDANELQLVAIRSYFDWISQTLRSVEQAQGAAEPKHLTAILKFAEQAFRHPLNNSERENLLRFYEEARDDAGMDHEAAIRETLVCILLYPDLCYRIDLIAGNNQIEPLSDYALASRLSYFLWSSIPDAELLTHAAAGDLHKQEVIIAQAKRMMRDRKARALAVEFGCNWLDIRHFESLSTVDVNRFPQFDSDLKAAMAEEPIRLMLDVFQSDRSVLDLLYGNDTFVNASLAKHYAIPFPSEKKGDWHHVTNAAEYERGGLLPMAVFLTQNSPGLRTSPVKRGNWLIKNILGERIAAPPPGVPELPKDEAQLELPLREVLARHRADASCAVCHERFDSFGLVFEGFGPIGERRSIDLGGRAIEADGEFSDGEKATGVAGVKAYIESHRENDFVNNLSGKLLAYALGRSLLLSDDSTLKQMQQKLAQDGYRFESLIESIVTSRQFLNKRGETVL